jgi:hypothetical protein
MISSSAARPKKGMPKMKLNTPARCAIGLLLVVLAGCTEKKPEQGAGATPQAQPSESVRPAEPAPSPSPAAAAVPAQPPAARSRDVVVLTGSPMGGVRLEHKLHVERAGNKCETCHHASRPEKPATAPQQACSTCHTKVAAPPMKTKYQAAFHNPMSQAGTCVDCHKAQNLKGKKAPVKCAECHKKENS